MRSERMLLVACALAGCRPTTTTTTDAAREAAPAPVASSSSHGFVRPTAHEVVERWNDAHNKHDARALEALYAPRVAFYGKTLTNAECAAKKAAAFEKSPDYAQSLRKVTFYPTSEAEQARGSTVVWFTKTSIIGGKSTDYPAALGIAPDGLVTFESDDVTNTKLANAWFEAHNWCTSPGLAPNDALMAPYKVSAKSAVARVRRSKYFAGLRSDEAGPMLDLDEIVSCPVSCDRSEPHGCHYQMGIIDPADRRFSHALIYVDAVTGELSYQSYDGWHTEALAE